MKVSLIAAIGNQRQLGQKGKIPWHLPQDFKQFKERTMGHIIVMGRKTYESIGRLLPGRTTVILTKQENYEVEGAVICHNREEVIAYAVSRQEDELFVCGGGEIYNLFLDSATDMYISWVDYNGIADAYFPKFEGFKKEVLSTHEAEHDRKRPSWYLTHYKMKDEQSTIK